KFRPDPLKIKSLKAIGKNQAFYRASLAGIKCYFSYDNKSWIEPDYHWDEPGVITSLKTKPSPAQ
ncbi:hypothetical protein AALA73_12065, partial [Parasutterella excrementihominis]|uniref:hypothetical protein n=1 Tax=Parasutterella excrementihominis TaxID=487175 RepID=UPI003514E14E